MNDSTNCVSLMNPCSSKHHAYKDYFSHLDKKHQVVVLAATGIVALATFFTLGSLAVLTFRKLSEKFHVKKVEESDSQTTEKVKGTARILLEQILKTKTSDKRKVLEDKKASPFTLAIFEKDLKKVKKFLKEGVPADPKDEKSVKNPIDVNKPDENSGDYPLQLAAEYGNKQIVRELLKDIKDIDATNADGATALYLAAKANNKEIVEYLLKHTKAKADIANKQTGRLPVHEAARNGNKEAVMNLLLRSKADIKAKDKEDRTALSLAAEYGHSSIVQYLIEQEADVQAADNQSKRPLHWAAQQGNKDTVKILIKNIKDVKDINAKDSAGNTALSLAVESDKHKVAKALLEAGADANIVDKEGRLPLHVAAENGYSGIVDLLAPINITKNINALDNEKNTALSLAAAKGNSKEVVDILLKRNANANIADDSKRLPLHWAAEEGHSYIADKLMRNTNDINAQDNEKRTALSLAAAAGKTKIVKALLENKVKANANLADKDGMLPLHWAAKGGYKDIVNLLISNDVTTDINAKANRMTALEWAVKEGKVEVVKVLKDAKALEN